jgi:hypothetical protein
MLAQVSDHLLRADAGRTSVPARVRRRARTAGVVRSRCRAGRCGKSLSSRT